MSGETERGPSVLLATDDSPSARVAEDWVIRLRWAQAPTVEVVCVAGGGITRLGWGLQTYREPVRLAVEGLRQSELYAAERIANEVGERLQHAGLTVHTLARQGDCSEEVRILAEVERPDLVVVGPRGRSEVAAAILGSVTHSLIAAVAQPLLVARPPLAPAGRLPDHVLLVVDGTPSAKAPLAWLERSGWLDGGRLTLLGLLGDRAGLGPDEPPLTDELARLVAAEATAVLEDLTRPLAETGVLLNFVLRGGHPLRATRAAIDELGVDLVAVGATPYPGRDPLPQKIARYSPVSVLLVPAA